MRSPFYVWSDGKDVTITDGPFGVSSVTMPEETLEELSVMVALEILSDGRVSGRDGETGMQAFTAVARRAHEKHGGNFGCDAASAFLGEQTANDYVQSVVGSLAAATALDEQVGRVSKRWWKTGDFVAGALSGFGIAAILVLIVEIVGLLW